MVENVQRRITLIVSMLIIAVLCMILPESPFRLGLDLQGGTRLVYRFDFAQALADGTISQAEFANKPQLLQDFIEITRNRVNPHGTLEISLRPQGEDRVVIELPGTALASASAQAPLDLALTPHEYFPDAQDN